MKKIIIELIVILLFVSTTTCYGDVIEASSKKVIAYVSMGRLKPLACIWFSSKCEEEELSLKGEMYIERKARRAYQFSDKLEIKIDGKIYFLPIIGRIKINSSRDGIKTTSASYYIKKNMLGKILSCKTIAIKISYSMADPTVLKIPPRMKKEWKDAIINTYIDADSEYDLSFLMSEE